MGKFSGKRGLVKTIFICVALLPYIERSVSKIWKNNNIKYGGEFMSQEAKELNELYYGDIIKLNFLQHEYINKMIIDQRWY